MPIHPTSWRCFLIFFHLRLGLPCGLFPSDLPTKILYGRLLSPIRSTCSSYLFFLFILPLSLRSSHQNPVWTSPVPNTFYVLLLSNFYWFYLFPSDLPTKILYGRLLSPIRSTCSSYLIFIDFTTRAIFGEGTVFDCHVTLSVIAPNCRTPSAYVSPPVWEQYSIYDEVVQLYTCYLCVLFVRIQM